MTLHKELVALSHNATEVAALVRQLEVGLRVVVSCLDVPESYSRTYQMRDASNYVEGVRARSNPNLQTVVPEGLHLEHDVFGNYMEKPHGRVRFFLYLLVLKYKAMSPVSLASSLVLDSLAVYNARVFPLPFQPNYAQLSAAQGS